MVLTVIQFKRTKKAAEMNFVKTRKKNPLISLVLGAVLLFGGGIARAAQEPSSSCGVCHSDRKVEYQNSIHARADVRCVDCHGGNERDLTDAAHEKRFGFRGKFSRKEIVLLCGNCHAKSRLMNTYGIRSDQLTQYKTSAHGQALFRRNDPNVAICTDCHGVHGVVSVKSPSSPVYYFNVPQTCGRCHSNKKMMDRYHLPADIVQRYREGVHGKLLVQKNRRDVPNCIRCHGSHGAAPPGVNDIENVCGQCHVRTRDYYDKSAHKMAFLQNGISQCMSCHAPHRTEKAVLNYFDKKCSRCHDKNSGEFRRAQQIRVQIESVQQDIQDVYAYLHQAQRRGIYIDDYLEQLSEARTRLVEAIPASHSLRLEDVEQFTSEARGVAADVRIAVEGKLGERNFWRYLILGVWIFIIILEGALFLQMRRKRKAENTI